MKGLYKTHYCCPDPLSLSNRFLRADKSTEREEEEKEEEEDVAVGNGCVTDVGSCWGRKRIKSSQVFVCVYVCVCVVCVWGVTLFSSWGAAGAVVEVVVVAEVGWRGDVDFTGSLEPVLSPH